MTATPDGYVTVIWQTRAKAGRELVPQMLELIDGSIEDGITLLHPIRPAR